jgi:hypothetical protein
VSLADSKESVKLMSISVLEMEKENCSFKEKFKVCFKGLSSFISTFFPSCLKFVSECFKVWQRVQGFLSIFEYSQGFPQEFIEEFFSFSA